MNDDNALLYVLGFIFAAATLIFLGMMVYNLIDHGSPFADSPHSTSDPHQEYIDQRAKKLNEERDQQIRDIITELQVQERAKELRRKGN